MHYFTQLKKNLGKNSYLDSVACPDSKHESRDRMLKTQQLWVILGTVGRTGGVKEGDAAERHGGHTASWSSAAEGPASPDPLSHHTSLNFG